MKVLQILPSLEVGGVERGVIDLARAMKKRGDHCVVISSGGQLVAELDKMGIPHYRLNVHRKSILSLGLIPKIAEVIRREQIDIVHARSRVPAWLAWFAARQTNTPFITTCHGYYSTHLLSHIMGWGKKVIAISRIIGRHMIDDFGVSPDAIRLIHRGIDLTHFKYKSDKYDGAQPRTLRIINIARLSPIKGQLEFLKAVHQLRRKIQNFEVWLVGAEGRGKHKYTDKLEETIQQLGLESCVKLLGTRRDIGELLNQSDLAVLSTLVPEAFGRVVVEAGSSGTAALATRVGGVLDIIDDGENGRLVPPGDTDAMADAMYDMLTDREKCKQYAVKLRKKIEDNFTLEHMLNKTMAVYQEVKQEKRILVTKLGAAGDLILIVPSLRMIRSRYPDSHISLLVDKRLASLVSKIPYVNEIIPVDRQKLSRIFYLLKLAKKLRRENYDWSVDFQNSKWTHLLSFLSGIRERFGFARGYFGFLVNRPDRSHHVPESPVKNQFRILSKLGITELDESLELWPDDQAQERVRSMLKKESGSENGQRLIGLVVGSSPNWPTKRWPREYFQQLSDRLIQELNCRIILIGSKQDTEWVEGVTLPGKNVTNLIGKTTMEDLIVLVSRLDALVTGDTAPLHVASAMKTKVVALFGPTDPRRHMPPGNDHVVLNRHLACQPCYQGKCRNDEELACLKHISVEEVFGSVQKQLSAVKNTGVKDTAYQVSRS